jgi:protein involved in polysaccharide export with SLBB domain
MMTAESHTSPMSLQSPACGPITIRGFQGVAITGQVRRAATIAWREGMKLDEAIHAAGGVAPGAARAILIRLGSDPAVVRLASAWRTRLLPGDNVRVEVAAA